MRTGHKSVAFETIQNIYEYRAAACAGLKQWQAQRIRSKTVIVDLLKAPNNCILDSLVMPPTSTANLNRPHSAGLASWDNSWHLMTLLMLFDPFWCFLHFQLYLAFFAEHQRFARLPEGSAGVTWVTFPWLCCSVNGSNGSKQWCLRSLAFKVNFKWSPVQQIKMTCSNLRWPKISQSAPDFTSLNSCQLLVCDLLGLALSTVAVFCRSFQLVFLSRSVQGPPYGEVGAFWAWKTTERATGDEAGDGRCEPVQACDEVTAVFQCSFFCVGFQMQFVWVSSPVALNDSKVAHQSCESNRKFSTAPETRSKERKKAKLKCVISSLAGQETQGFSTSSHLFSGSRRGYGGSISCVRLTMKGVGWKAGKLMGFWLDAKLIKLVSWKRFEKWTVRIQPADSVWCSHMLSIEWGPTPRRKSWHNEARCSCGLDFDPTEGQIDSLTTWMCTSRNLSNTRSRTKCGKSSQRVKSVHAKNTAKWAGGMICKSPVLSRLSIELHVCNAFGISLARDDVAKQGWYYWLLRYEITTMCWAELARYKARGLQTVQKQQQLTLEWRDMTHSWSTCGSFACRGTRWNGAKCQRIWIVRLYNYIYIYIYFL